MKTFFERPYYQNVVSVLFFAPFEKTKTTTTKTTTEKTTTTKTTATNTATTKKTMTKFLSYYLLWYFRHIKRFISKTFRFLVILFIGTHNKNEIFVLYTIHRVSNRNFYNILMLTSAKNLGISWVLNSFNILPYCLIFSYSFF